MRSRVTENCWPTSSSVWSVFMPMAKRMRNTRSSRGVSEASTRVVDLAAVRHRPRAPPALARMLEMPDFVDVCVCVSVFLAHSRASAAASWRALDRR
jgi:hypothetical protein